jgi:aminomethyltransferase
MRAQYSLLCNAEGGVLDDLIVYRLAPPSPPNDGGEGGGPYLVVVNAANRERDVAWWRSQAQALRLDVELVDRTFELAMIALQGPAAEALLQPLAEAPLENMRYYSALRTRVTSREVLLARTGYTGEDGFELMVASDQATDLWEELRAQAIPSPPVDWGTEGGGRGQPSAAGLGARDTLRLEAGMALYGHELTEETTPLEAGLGRVVKLEKGPFVGAEALAAQRAAGLRRQLVGFEMVDSAIPRQGYTVTTAPPAVGEPSTGEPIGVVTSGTFGPSVQRQIGMAYVPPELAAEGAELGVVVRERTARARVRPLPFWKHRTKRIRT